MSSHDYKIFTGSKKSQNPKQNKTAQYVPRPPHF